MGEATAAPTPYIYSGEAAGFSRTKAAFIREEIEAGTILSLTLDEKTHIPRAAAKRLSREAGTMQSVKRTKRILLLLEGQADYCSIGVGIISRLP
jgi:hypothetical protein